MTRLGVVLWPSADANAIVQERHVNSGDSAELELIAGRYGKAVLQLISIRDGTEMHSAE